MNTQSNTMPESFEPQGIAPAVWAATRPLYWSVRRELWENRSIYMAPLAAGGLFLFGFLISLAGLPHKMRGFALDPEHQRRAITMPYHFAAGLLMATALIVSVFYSLDALYGERWDRSILFWKSLPVSDFTTVLAKAGIAIVLMPLIAFAITVPLQLAMLLLSSVVVAGSGQSVATLWTDVAWFQMSLGLLYHLVTIHILWHAPIYSWLLLVSGWARRAAFLWAFLPPLAIGMVEKIAFNTTYFAKLLGNRLAGGPEAMGFPEDGLPIDPGMHLTPGHFLMSPGLWLGLGVAAIFLAAAVRMRREHGPL
jgi:ABC-2 type transport system permease protein